MAVTFSPEQENDLDAENTVAATQDLIKNLGDRKLLLLANCLADVVGSRTRNGRVEIIINSGHVIGVNALIHYK